MFPLFNKQLDLSKQYFKKLLKKGDTAIDATCGNGHDTLFLASLILTEETGTLHTLDIQDEALESAKKLIVDQLPPNAFKRIHFIKGCHSKFPQEILESSVKLIVYNLGYLPGGNKAITTLSDTTLKSIEQALKLIAFGGVISITCYPGHEAGAIEEELILQFVKGLDPKVWNCCHHTFINREKAPSLLLLQKVLKEKS